MTRPLSGVQAPADSWPVSLSSQRFDAAADWRVGRPELLREPEPEPCCFGVDLPGVGLAHSAACARAGEPKAPVTFPPVLRFDDLFERREALLIQLVVAASRLADKTIRASHGRAWCAECSSIADDRDQIQHVGDCQAARIKAVLGELCALSLDPNHGEEAAPDGETGRASDGIRSRGTETEAPVDVQFVGSRELLYLDEVPIAATAKAIVDKMLANCDCEEGR